MRLSALRVLPMTAVLALGGCHSDPPSPSQPPAVVSPQNTASPGSAPAQSVIPARPQHTRPKSAKSLQDVAQLDLNSEGGVRDGSYAMWVHVTRHGKPLGNVKVIAFSESSKPVAVARTNEDGDAMLKVKATTYRVAARQGPSRSEKTLTFHPGDQLALELEP